MLAFLQHTHNLIPVMEWELQFAASTGLSMSQTRFALSFLGAVSAGMLIRLISYPKLRQLYSLLVGFAVLYYPFGSGVMHAFFTSFATYLLMWLIPKKCGTLSWLVNFPYLLALHVANASGVSWNQGALDFTGAQMVLTLKLISTAMCYQDYNSKTPQEMSAYQRTHHISALPSFLEYLSYVFCFGNLLAGPVIEYKDYQDFINLRGLWDPKAVRRVPVWGAFQQGLRAMVTGIVACAVYLSLEKAYGFSLVFTDWYYEQNTFMRMLVMQAVGTVYRSRYYFAWSLGEASLAFAGMDFKGWEDPQQQQQKQQQKQQQRQQQGAATDASGVEESETDRGTCDATPGSSSKLVATWGRCNNALPFKVEFCDSSRMLAAYWNITTGIFLRRYVYERLTPPGGKPTFRTLLATQLVSGLWHGLYAGYFMFFGGSAVFFAHSTVTYNWEKVLPRAVYSSWPWWAVKVYITKQCLDFLAIAFLILTFKESWAAWQSVYCIPLIWMVTVLVLGRVFPGPGRKSRSREAAKEGKDGAAVAANGSIKVE